MAIPELQTEPLVQGGGFVLGAPPSGACFAAEDFSEQHHLIAATAEQFAMQEVEPQAAAIENQDFDVVRRLLRKAGELGLTAVDVPEPFDGLGMDFISSAIVADRIAKQGAFSVIFGAHVGLGTLPLVYFGNAEQQARYLPGLATAEIIGAYALSEASSGSDALAMTTRAELEGSGQNYRLNGEKHWISNAGFADLFTLFARTGDGISAFLLERNFAGVSTGREEHKMGIKGSSTRPVLLRDAKVPAGNVLGGVGHGQSIALQILNIGRVKLGAACLGGARDCLQRAVTYARERHAFGRAIADFGLIQQKIADMVIGLFLSEATVYRTVGLMAPRMETLDEYAVECALVKIQASEMLDRVVDHLVQIHGGYGFVEDYPAARPYRDARVNRIFEGTNEINRLLASGMLLRRGAKGTLALAPAIAAVTAEMGRSNREPVSPAEAMRKLALFAAGVAFRRHGEALRDQQEILAGLTDLLIGLYTLQSTENRVTRLEGERKDLAARIMTVAAGETLAAGEGLGRKVIAACTAGDERRTALAFVRSMARNDAQDEFGLRREIAAAAIEHGGYPFG